MIGSNANPLLHKRVGTGVSRIRGSSDGLWIVSPAEAEQASVGFGKGGTIREGIFAKWKLGDVVVDMCSTAMAVSHGNPVIYPV